MKKNILITAYSLDLGGIETSLINLLKNIDYKNYDVTLILEKKTGLFLEQVPSEVNVIDYNLYSSKNVLKRKIINRSKLLFWKFKLHNKFYFSCSFCTYSIPGSHLARAASKNNAIWIHGNYYVLYGDKMSKFFESVRIKKFKKIVFVSNENKSEICSHYQEIENKSYVCNNLVDGELILKKSMEKIKYKKNKDEKIFVNIGRHEEHQKRLSRIISATKRLNDEGYKFKILFVGDGPDHDIYKGECDSLKLNNIIFVGRTVNPFPYYRMSDAVILSSEYEGYPVVFLESMILKKPILSTKISDWEDLDDKYGYFCELNSDGVYYNMKKFLDEGFKFKEKFDYKKYNKNILNKIYEIINEK